MGNQEAQCGQSAQLVAPIHKRDFPLPPPFLRSFPVEACWYKNPFYLPTTQFSCSSPNRHKPLPSIPILLHRLDTFVVFSVRILCWNCTFLYCPLFLHATSFLRPFTLQPCQATHRAASLHLTPLSLAKRCSSSPPPVPILFIFPSLMAFSGPLSALANCPPSSKVLSFKRLTFMEVLLFRSRVCWLPPPSRPFFCSFRSPI